MLQISNDPLQNLITWEKGKEAGRFGKIIALELFIIGKKKR